jgi:aspartate kinase
MGELIVCKYGGTSITSEEDIIRIGKTVRADKRRRVIVVSAPNLDKKRRTTNMLLELARTKDRNLIGPLVDQYTPFNSPKVSRRFESELEKRFDSKLPERAYVHNLAALGDEASAWAVAEQNGFIYLDPKDLFRVDPNGKILPISKGLIRRNLGERLESTNEFYVVAGFSGSTRNGRRITFSRNGSNITSTYSAAALRAGLIETYTDIDGVYDADPRIVGSPKKILWLTFKEMRDLSYAGFNIFNSEAVIPAELAGIPIEIKSAREPNITGTYIVTERAVKSDEPPFIGIAYRNGFCSMDVSSPGLNDNKGIMARLTDVFLRNDISLEYTPGGIDDISFIFNAGDLKGIDPIGSLKRELSILTGEHSQVEFRDDLGSIVVAGKRLKKTIGRVDADIRGLLDESHVDVEFSEQGRQRRCLIYGVDHSDGPRAVNLIYERYLRR